MRIVSTRVVGISLGLIVAAGVVLAQERPGRDRDANVETAVPGDPARGKAIFEGSAGCLACHRVVDKGSRLGPDLSEAGSRSAADILRKALLEPNPEVQPRNRYYRVITRDGAIVTGKLLNQDQFSLQMLDSKERLVACQKANLREYTFVKTPPMPSYQGKLSPEEVTDLVCYLASLKGAARK
jgi:putative heme-binding domain-containing protein